MIEYTPGPWELGGETIDNQYPLRRYDTIIGLIFSWADGNNATYREALANARLIAAAPDLLEALIAARQALALTVSCWLCKDDMNHDDEQRIQSVRALVRAAIARATGEGAR